LGRTNSVPPRSGRPASQKALVIVAFVLSIASLFYVLHDFEPEKLLGEIRAMHWGWVAAAVIFDILVYFLQGWRWSLLLRPVANVPYARSIRAIYVGLFANEILPLRTGEIIRCYLQGRWSGLPFTVTLSSALIERIFDGLWLCICLFVTTYFVELPELYITLGKILAAIVVLGGALLAAAMFAKQRTREAFQNHRWLNKLTVLLEDLHIIGHSPYLYLSAAASLPYLLLQILPIYALAQGYGVDISLGQGFALMVILRLVAVVPQAPGNLGTFQAAAVFGLVLFGIDSSLAKRFSFVVWAVITLPLLIAGFVALAITGLSLTEIREQAESASAPEPSHNV
jgi:glycosyltransferase 2 family protein